MEEVELLKRKIFNSMNLGIMGLAASVGILLNILAPQYKMLIYPALLYCIPSFVLFILSIKKFKLEPLSHLYLAMWTLFTAYMSINSDGIQGPMTFIFMPIPLIALVFLKPKECLAWTSVVLSVLGFLTYNTQDLNFAEHSKWLHFLFAFVSLVAVLIVGFIHVSFTEKYRKQTEDKIDKLNQTQAQLVQSAKLASLGEMSAGVAHEINNPLTIINMRINQIQRYYKTNSLSEAEIDKFFKDIHKSSSRIIRIINSLRVFAKDTKEEPFSETTFNSVMEEVMELAYERLKYGGIKVNVVSSSNSIVFECRKVQIAHVLINLINNAFDAIKELKEKWVRIEGTETQDKIYIRVIDSGKGIPIEIADKIMQPFFTTKPIGQGTGLGLSVSLGIVENHNGSLTIDHNSPNTCFTLIFPKRQKEEFYHERNYSFSR